MKRVVLLLLAVFAFSTADFAATATPVSQFSSNENQNTAKTFANLSIAEYEQMSGKNLNFFQKAKLKIAQKQIKKALKKQSNSTAAGSEISQGLYIVLAIFGLAWIAMGVMDDWKGQNWIINLLLSILFILPGLIHALIVMGEYYD